VIRLSLSRNLKPARVKAASLYIVIVIALIIALLCEGVIAAAFYYRAYHALRNRQERLDNNVRSGLNMLLTDRQLIDYDNKQVQLFEDTRDTIRLSKRFWGGFDVGVSKAYMGKDSAVAAMLIGNQADSTKWFAIWLADDDRPLSVSGKTVIGGKVCLPKAGIRTAYVDNHGYEGPPEFVSKKHPESKRELPELDLARLAKIDLYFSASPGNGQFKSDSVACAFSGRTREFHFKGPATLAGISLHGNIIIRCDSLLTIDSTATLSDVMIFAQAIVVRPGFRGRCQLFARDSVNVGNRSAFAYPSMIALVRSEAAQVQKQGLIRFGKGCSFFGGLITWEKIPGTIPPAIELSANGIFNGQIYTGLLGLGDQTVINGSVTCRRFLYRSSFSLFENYLIDAHIDANALSPFYSSAAVFPYALPQTKKIVQWLE
jgi:hypothetical protein